jgi:hypothetical protein
MFVTFIIQTTKPPNISQHNQHTINEHSRSIDIRHHAVHQDYLAGKLRIGGVRTDANPSDILAKYLPAPTHMRHASYLNITFPTLSTTKDGNPTPITYTQNGNRLALPTSDRPPNPRQRTSRTAAPLSWRPQHGRASVCLHQRPIHIVRCRPSLPSSCNKNGRQQFKHPRRKQPGATRNSRCPIQPLTPRKAIPSAKLARSTKHHQSVDRQQAYMRTLQHVPPQAHHTAKHSSNHLNRHTHRQHRKPPASQHNQPLQHHKIRPMSVDHSLLENHQQQRATERKHSHDKKHNALKSGLSPSTPTPHLPKDRPHSASPLPSNKRTNHTRRRHTHDVNACPK